MKLSLIKRWYLYFNKQRESVRFFSFVLFIALYFMYYLFHYNYLEIPTADYIGNFMPFVQNLLAGDFFHLKNKILPSYPVFVALLYKTGFAIGNDRIYSSALLGNLLLFPFFIYLLYTLYNRFMTKKQSRLIVVLLLLNPYTLYMVLNAELEFFMVTMGLLTFNLMSKKSSMDLVTAFVVSLTKWDSVFIIPALQLFRWLQSKKISHVVVTGVIAGSGIVAWVGLFALNKGSSQNDYISEIARRGPNVYRYLGDLLFVSSGFLQWLGLDIYYGHYLYGLNIVAAGVIGVFFLLIVAWGVYTWINKKDSIKAPLTLYIVGYILIHLIYQNSKARYVLPILWFLNLVIGLGAIAMVKKYMSIDSKHNVCKKYFPLIIVMFLSVYALVLIISDYNRTPWIWILLLGSSALFLILQHIPFKTGLQRVVLVLLTFFIVSINLYYSRKILEHYNDRRLEFKQIAYLYKDFYQPGDKLLISESKVVKYFSGLDDSCFVLSQSLGTDDPTKAIARMHKLGVTYLYIDDFYIRRLQLKDKNALEKRAVLLKELRDNSDQFKDLKLIKTIEVGTEIRGFLYRIESNTKL